MAEFNRMHADKKGVTKFIKTRENIFEYMTPSARDAEFSICATKGMPRYLQENGSIYSENIIGNLGKLREKSNN